MEELFVVLLPPGMILGIIMATIIFAVKVNLNGSQSDDKRRESTNGDIESGFSFGCERGDE